MPASSEPDRSFPTAALFATLAVLFAVIAAPTPGWRDGGEIASASFHLGIAHPTGFPLPMLLVKASCLLIPLGDVALRSGLASCLAMAGAASLMARIAYRASGTAGAVCAGALVGTGFVASPSIVWLGTTIEVYAPALLVSAAALVLVLDSERTRDPRPAILACLLAGLATGCHAAAVIGAGAAAAAGIAVSRPRARSATLGIAAAAAGAIVLAYLPVRSVASPTIMWDDLSGIHALARHLSGARIREAFVGRTWGTSLPWDAPVLARLLAGDLGAVLLGLAPAGAILAWRRARLAAALLAATAVADILFALLAHPMGMADRQAGFLATGCLITLAGMGLGEIVSRVVAVRPLAGAAVAVAMLAGAPLARPPGTFLVREDEVPVIWAGDLLSGLPPGALVLGSSDALSGLGLYLQHVEGVRPDVGVVARQHLWNDLAITKALARSHPALVEQTLAAGPGVGPRAGRLAREASQRDVYWEAGDGSDLVSAFGTGPPPLGLGRGAAPPLALIGGRNAGQGDVRALSTRLRALLDLAGIDLRHEGRSGPSKVTRRFLARDFLSLGLILAWSGDLGPARLSLRRSLEIKPDYAPALVDLAILEAARGNLGEGIDLARQAVRAEPGRARARLTLERLLAAAGKEGIDR